MILHDITIHNRYFWIYSACLHVLFCVFWYVFIFFISGWERDQSLCLNMYMYRCGLDFVHGYLVHHGQGLHCLFSNHFCCVFAVQKVISLPGCFNAFLLQGLLGMTMTSWPVLLRRGVHHKQIFVDDSQTNIYVTHPMYPNVINHPVDQPFLGAWGHFTTQKG
jgi:hypothetical protein